MEIRPDDEFDNRGVHEPASRPAQFPITIGSGENEDNDADPPDPYEPGPAQDSDTAGIGDSAEDGTTPASEPTEQPSSSPSTPETGGDATAAPEETDAEEPPATATLTDDVAADAPSVEAARAAVADALEPAETEEGPTASLIPTDATDQSADEDTGESWQGNAEIEYLPGQEERHTPEEEQRVAEYLNGIVDAGWLEANLREDFVHIDGGLMRDEAGQFVATNLSSPAAAPDYDPSTGKEEFIGVFRNIVNELSMPVDELRGTWLPTEAYAPLLEQVQAFMDEHNISIGGDLLGVAVVDFPYLLRPGGPPLDIPPPFRHLIGEDEPHFNTELRATGVEAEDRFTVRAVQMVFADEQGRITGRIGLTTNDPRLPAFPAMLEVSAARGLIPQGPPAPSPSAVAEELWDAARAG